MHNDPSRHCVILNHSNPSRNPLEWAVVESTRFDGQGIPFCGILVSWAASSEASSETSIQHKQNPD